MGEVESARIPEFELKELSNMFNHVLRMLKATRFQGEPVEEYRDELILKIADFFNEAVEIVESWGTRAYGNYGSTRACSSRESELLARGSLHEAKCQPKVFDKTWKKKKG